MHDDLGIPPSKHGCLEKWAKEGVMLLNAVLTVRENQPRSHAGKGWELFTSAVIEKLCQRNDPVIFVLWGKDAQEKCRPLIEKTNQRHFLLLAPHPSPFSAYSGFFGCRHFSKIQDHLKRLGKRPIDWALPQDIV